MRNGRHENLERLRAELAAWRERLGGARVQAKLGRMEAADRLHELGERFEPVWTKAKRQLEAVIESGSQEARTLAKSLLAGWRELRRAHRELVASERAARAQRQARRRGL